MSDYSPQQVTRRNVWAHASAVTMRQSEQATRLLGLGMMATAALVAVVVAIWR